MINRTYDRLLFVDTETGGLDPLKHSLLTIGIAVWDLHDGLLDSSEYYIKNKEYLVTKEAQKVNKFDKEMHESKAQSSQIIIKSLTDFCSKYFDANLAVPLAGHNTQFDIGFLKVFLEENGRSFGSIFSHRIIDTYSIIKFLCYCGKIEQNISSSAEAFRYFNIKVDNRHTALGDVIATVELFDAMIKLTMK